MIVTATQVTVFANLTDAASAITDSGLIPVVQDRINWICNNYFTTDLYVKGPLTFNATARTVVTSGDFTAAGFATDDEIYIYQSYRNDGYYTISTVTATTVTLVTGDAVVDELSGRSILVSVVQWPRDLVYTAAQMVAYDYQERNNRGAGVKSKSLGPWSETYESGGNGEFGYPRDILAPLYDHRITRLM